MLIGNFPNGRKFPFSPPLPITARGICLEGLPVMIYHPELSYESYHTRAIKESKAITMVQTKAIMGASSKQNY